MDDPVDPAALTWAAKFSNVPAADPGAAGDPNAGQAPAGDPPTAPPPTADPQTAPAPGDPSAPLAAPVATGAGGGTDPGATGDPNPPPATGQSDPPATTDAPKKINVTIVTSYGQNVRYWIQDRATDANNEAPEGSGTVLIGGDEHGPGDAIALSCIETPNGARICYQRESYPQPTGGGMTPWSSVSISDGDTFTIQETAQTLPAPAPSADPNAGAPAGDPTAGQTPSDPQTAPAPGDPSAPLAVPVATGAGGGTDPGATGDPSQTTTTGPADPAATGGEAPKKINVTIVTSYGQSVRYWIQDRATDANNEAAEGSGAVLIDGDEHGPGESIGLSCIETANGASICYRRDSYSNPPGGGTTSWSSVSINDGGSFTIQETAQPLGATAAAGDPTAGAPSGDPTAGQALADPQAVTAQSGDPGVVDASSISLPTFSKSAPFVGDLTDDPAWQTGYDAGFANPNADVQPQVSYLPQSAEAFQAGVKAGQAAAKKALSAVPAGTDPANKLTFSNSAIQKIYDDAIAAAQDVSPNQVAALTSLDSGRSGPWKTLGWSTIAFSSASRIIKPSLIDQRTLNVCGSAAALEGEAAQNATGYADEVIEVFSKGTFKGKAINAQLFTSKPASGMDAGDWMMLSSAQDVVNAIRHFDGTKDDGAAGTLDYNDRSLLETVDDAKNAETLGATLGREASSSRKVVDLLNKHGDKVTVIASCDAGLLNNEGTGVPDGKENHDVRLINLDYGSTVKFKIYTWGREMELTWTQARYNEWIFGYEIGTRDASIELP